MENNSLCIKIDPEINLKFREKVLKLCGVQKGCISKCVEEALKSWVDNHESSSQNGEEISIASTNVKEENKEVPK